MALIDKVKATPINSTAGKVVSSGVHFDSSKRIAQLHWESPPQTILVPREMPDLTGRKCGLFTVVGLYKRATNGKGGSKWLVRCVCGHYETRKSAKITGGNDPNDCCDLCRELEFHQRRQHYFEHGCDRKSMT